MHYNHLRLLFFITVGLCCRATATTSEESNSVRNGELSAEQIFCIQDVISSTPNVNKAKVDQVLFAFENMHFGYGTVQKTAGGIDLLTFGLREKHTNLTQSQWNASLGGTAFIQHVQNITLLTEDDMSEFVQTLESIVDLEQKANIHRIFGDIFHLDPLAARWYLFSMAVKNSLGIDPTPFYALLHGDPNNTLCSNATIAERYGNRQKVGNMTEAEIYKICFDFARYAPLVDMNKVREYVKIFAKGYFFTTPDAAVTVTQSDAVLELMYVEFVRSTTNLTLSEWKSMFKTKESDSVINIFADGSLTNSNLTTYKGRFEKVLPSEETDGVFEMLTNLSKYEKNEVRSVRSVAGVIGFSYKAMLDLNNVIPCWKVTNGIPYGHPGDYCVNKKLYCNANLDKNSIFYHDEFCAGNVV